MECALKIEPQNNFVLVEATTLQHSKIAMPEKTDDDDGSRCVWHVVACGPEVKVPLEKGDEVVFRPGPGYLQLDPAKYDGRQLALVNAEMCCAVIHRDSPTDGFKLGQRIARVSPRIVQ